MLHYTSPFRTQIAKEAIKDRTYAEISKKYGINCALIKRWADDYEKYGDLSFEENGLVWPPFFFGNKGSTPIE